MRRKLHGSLIRNILKDDLWLKAFRGCRQIQQRTAIIHNNPAMGSCLLSPGFRTGKNTGLPFVEGNKGLCLFHLVFSQQNKAAISQLRLSVIIKLRAHTFSGNLQALQPAGNILQHILRDSACRKIRHIIRQLCILQGQLESLPRSIISINSGRKLRRGAVILAGCLQADRGIACQVSIPVHILQHDILVVIPAAKC